MRRSLVVAALLAAALAAPAGAVHETGSEFRVTLSADGDAEVLLKESFALNDTDERRRFERLANNETVRQQRLETFRARLQDGATSAEEVTGRSMAIRNASLSTERYGNGTGVLRLRAGWTNLAAVGSDRLVVTAPFGGALTVNRSLVVVAPEGFTRVSTRPPPARARERTATWGRGQDLSGFRAVFEGPTPGGTPTATPAPSGVGVFVGAAALALLPAGALAAALWGRRGT